MKNIYKNNDYFSIGEFVNLCDTTRETLYHYEKQKLLMPTIDEHNGYRYYKPADYYRFMYIAHLAKIGFSLNEVKDYLQDHTLENYFNAALSSVKRTKKQQDLLALTADRTHRAVENLNSYIARPCNLPQILYREEEYFFKTPLLPGRTDQHDVIALSEADKFANEHGFDRIRHFLGFYSSKSFTDERPGFECILSKTSSPTNCEEALTRPAGMYISMCYKGSIFDNNTAPYKIMKKYFEEHHFTPKSGVLVEVVVGPFYSNNPEEYINEISVQIE